MANAYQALTTPPRVFRDPKMCLRNIWTAPYYWDCFRSQKHPQMKCFLYGDYAKA